MYLLLKIVATAILHKQTSLVFLGRITSNFSKYIAAVFTVKRSLMSSVYLVLEGTDAGCPGADPSYCTATSLRTWAFSSSCSADCTVGNRPWARPLMVSGWLQRLQTSQTHMPLPQNLKRSLPFLCSFLTSKCFLPRSPPADFLCVFLVRIVSQFSRSVSLGAAWQGSSGLVFQGLVL